MTVLTANAAALLAGPRGRRLCLEYAMAVNPELGQVMFLVAHQAAPERSVLITLTGDGRDGSEPSPPAFTVADAVALIATTDLREIDTASVRAALRASVDAAMYWQPPDGHDTVCALPDMRAALAPVAKALLASPTGTSWKAARAEEQWAVDWHAPMDASPLPSNTMALLTTWDRWHREEEAREALEPPREMFSGTWWSAPGAPLRTRGHVADALELVEDNAGLEVATVIPIRDNGRARVLEITSAHDWAELCRAFPLEVTASRRGDWFHVTGRDGRWLLPEWSRVALDWDAVHLTTFAYLSAATSLIEIDDEYASVIGGWGPDATLWLTDTARESSEPRQHWVRGPGTGEWVRKH